jgi:hypothetical protein
VSVVEYFLEPLVRADTKVIVAVQAYLQVLFKLTLVKMRAALVATHKHILSPDDPILVADRFDLAFLFSEPGHKSSL